MLRVLLSLVLLVLVAGCAGIPRTGSPAELPTRAADAATVLAPFEDRAALPAQIAGLPLPEGRAFALLVLIPAPAVVDLSDPERARRGLVQFLNPVATYRAGTLMGHTMAGWRCADGAMGLVSKSGDDRNRGLGMVFRGWGLAAFLSEYADGHLIEPAEMSARHHRVLRQGRARILAVEVDEAGCQAVRRALVAYRQHPNRPERVFTMMRDPADLGGDGCAEFALWLIGHSGALGDLPALMRREITLRDSFVGIGSMPRSPLVTPFVAQGAPDPVPLIALMTGDWSQGRALQQIEVLDLELLRLAFDRVAGIAAPVPARLREDDAQARRLREASDRWVTRFARLHPFRHGRQQALVLMRR
ncbi:MAG: hypothetical protein Kow0013_18730 [Pararhodobacter sp.]